MKKFEITEEQIKQAYDAACEDWKQRIKEWFPELYKIESGWYYNNEKNVLSYYDFENINQYGFNSYGKWYQFDNVRLSGSEYPAPEKEVEERLIEEAKRRGFVEGVKINLTGKNEYVLKSNEFRFFGSHNTLGVKNPMCWNNVFQDGKWAEIISTPTTDEYITVNNIKYKRCN